MRLIDSGADLKEYERCEDQDSLDGAADGAVMQLFESDLPAQLRKSKRASTPPSLTPRQELDVAGQ